MAVLVASTITPATERKVSSSPTTDQWPLWKAKAPSPPPPYHHGEDKQRTRAWPPHKVFLLLVFNHIFFLSILRLLFSESFISNEVWVFFYLSLMRSATYFVTSAIYRFWASLKNLNLKQLLLTKSVLFRDFSIRNFKKNCSVQYTSNNFFIGGQVSLLRDL